MDFFVGANWKIFFIIEMNSKQILFAPFTHHARKADSTNILIYGDLEVCLREGAFYLVAKKWSEVNKYSTNQFHNFNSERNHKWYHNYLTRRTEILCIIRFSKNHHNWSLSIMWSVYWSFFEEYWSKSWSKWNRYWYQ